MSRRLSTSKADLPCFREGRFRSHPSRRACRGVCSASDQCQGAVRTPPFRLRQPVLLPTKKVPDEALPLRSSPTQTPRMRTERLTMSTSCPCLTDIRRPQSRVSGLSASAARCAPSRRLRAAGSWYKLATVTPDGFPKGQPTFRTAGKRRVRKPANGSTETPGLLAPLQRSVTELLSPAGRTCSAGRCPSSSTFCCRTPGCARSTASRSSD
jgi:hypothetical protein